MKFIKYILPAVVLSAAMTSCDSCDIDPVLPPIVPPTPTISVEPNTTILELKQKYWTSDQYSLTQIGLTDEGDSIIIRGRVISTDVTGNFYQLLAMRDETAPIMIRLYVNDIYKVYPYGADLAINVTGLYIGMYNNLLQIGSSEPDETSPTKIKEDAFKEISALNGWVDTEQAQPVTIDLDFLKTAKQSVEDRQEWQGQLVTINGLKFESVGNEFSPESTNTANQIVKDANGNKLTLRFSGRSSFAHRIVPAGEGSVTGILSFYSSDWQVIPCTLEDLKGFTPVEAYVPVYEGDGSEENPYNVASAISNQGGNAWVKGYIVGVMNPNNDYTMEYTAPFTVNSNIYLADNPNETVTGRMLPVQLPGGSVRTALNLVNNPGNLGKVVTLYGQLTSYFSQAGLKETSAYKLEDGNGGGDVTPPAASEKFELATSITDGKYIIWSDNVVATSLDKNFGYLPKVVCTPEADGTITTAASNLYTFKKEAAGWTIVDNNGKYLFMKDDFNSFNVAATLNTSDNCYYWNITAESDGSFKITNVGKGKTIRYSAQHGTFGAYPDANNGTATYLYQSVK